MLARSKSWSGLLQVAGESCRRGGGNEQPPKELVMPDALLCLWKHVLWSLYH